MKVKLVDVENELHAEGEISVHVAIYATILKRNERYYKFNGLNDKIVYFKEIEQPYVITEF